MISYGRFSAVLLPAILAGCGTAPTNVAQGNDVATAAPTVKHSPAPAATSRHVAVTAAPVSAVGHAEKTDLLKYSYSYPGAAGAIPGVKAKLERDADDAKAKALANAKTDRQAMAGQDFPFHTHEYQADWSVAGDTSRFLSLIGTIYAFTGGAHGMTVYDTLLWDKQVRRVIPVADLFTGRDALGQALRARFCDALDRERAKEAQCGGRT